MLLSGLVALSLGAASQPAPQRADSRTRVELAEFAECLVKSRRSDARNAVLEDWDSRKLAYRELLAARDCVRIGRRLRVNSEVLRANLAGALIAADLGPQDPAAIAAAPMLAYPAPDPLRTFDAKGRPVGSDSIERQNAAIQRKLSWRAIAQFGDCVARANPAAVPALAASQVASESELAALKAFSPQMPACLPRGVKLELDRSSLRGAITLAYYRLATAARAAGGAK